MAGYDMQAPTELIRQFEQLGADIDEITDKMVEAGAEAVLPTVKQKLAEANDYATGELLANITVKKVKVKDGKARKITFKGKSSGRRAVKGGKIYERKKEVRLGEVAAYTEYGRPGQAPTRFMQRSFIEKNDEMYAAMKRVWDNETRRYNQ